MSITVIPLPPLRLGIGADYGIYFLYLLRDSLRETKEIGAERHTFASVAKAVTLVAAGDICRANCVVGLLYSNLPSGQERSRQTVSRTLLRHNGIGSMRVARFASPFDTRGTVVLMIENLGGDYDMSTYLPGARRARRLSAANCDDAFVGSDFTSGDYRVADCTHQIRREEAVVGRPTGLVEPRARTPQVRDRQDFVARCGEPYDELRQLAPRFSASDVRFVGPARRRRQLMTLEPRNAQSNYRTVTRFERFHVNPGVSPECFTTRAMESDE